jgi:hypothetical protein
MDVTYCDAIFFLEYIILSYISFSVQQKKMGVRRGTNRFVSTSDTIAGVF